MASTPTITKVFLCLNLIHKLSETPVHGGVFHTMTRRDRTRISSKKLAFVLQKSSMWNDLHPQQDRHDFGRKIKILEIGSDGLWSLSGVFHRVSEQFRTRLRSGEREKSIEHESDPSRLSFAQDQPTKSEFDHRNSSLKYGIEQNYLLSQKAVEGHSYGSRDKDSKERSTKHPKETSNL